MEGICAVKLRGVVRVAHVGAELAAIEERVGAMTDPHLEGPLGSMVVHGGAGHAQEERGLGRVLPTSVRE